MQIDKNSSANDYSVIFSGLENFGETQAKFVPNQAYLYISEEQKFIFAGGRDIEKVNIPFKNSFLLRIWTIYEWN